MSIEIEGIFYVSWALNIGFLLMFLVHCWHTRSKRQPHLLASQSLMLTSLGLSLPYNYDKPLQRYRLIVAMCITSLSIATLSYSMFRGE